MPLQHRGKVGKWTAERDCAYMNNAKTSGKLELREQSEPLLPKCVHFSKTCRTKFSSTTVQTF